MSHRFVISSLPLLPLTLAVTLLSLCLTSCSRVQSVREARTIVAEADSLRNAGQSLSPFTFHLSPSKSDSAAMAEAAATLEPFRLFYPTDYAHANYYYGRILRTQGNQPEAMLAFLRVVHSRTKDHAIKGRSYCNIGIMCGLATEHELAYDMYECSAEEFMLANDTIAYYYALNDMAFALAEMGMKNEALSLLSIIPQQCEIVGVKIKVLETSAIAYNHAQLYDSAILCINEMQYLGYYESTGILNKAQAFDNLGQKDSALYYAEQVMNISFDWNDKYNALYILSHANPDLSNDSILSLTSLRADLGKFQEERQGQLSQATQLLQQDLNRKPNLGWLFAIIGTSTAIGVGIAIYVKRKRRTRQLISQQVKELQQKHNNLSNQNYQLEQKVSHRQRKMLLAIELFCKTIQNDSDLKTKLSWNDFDKMCAIVDERMFGLATKLKDGYNIDLIMVPKIKTNLQM